MLRCFVNLRGGENHTESLGSHIIFPIFQKLPAVALSPKAGSDKKHCAKRYLIPEQIEAEQSDWLSLLYQNIALSASNLIFLLLFRKMLIKAEPEAFITHLHISDFIEGLFAVSFTGLHFSKIPPLFY